MSRPKSTKSASGKNKNRGNAVATRKPPPKGPGRCSRSSSTSPASNSRKRKSQLSAYNDVYEAEEPELDEKNLDKIESLEYEQPETFDDDEEIDEDNVFTAEDKKKYAGWFDDDDDDDGGGGDDGMSDDEGGASDDDAEGEAGGRDMLDSDSDGGMAGADGSDEDEGDLCDGGAPEEDGEEDEDAWLMEQLEGSGGDELDDEEDEDGGSGLEQDGEDADEDAGRDGDLRNVMSGVLGEQKPNKRAKRERALANEVYPESGFLLNPGVSSADGSRELTMGDMIRGLGDKKWELGSAWKELQKLAKKNAPVAAPLPRVIKDRIERKAGYEKTSEEQAKWQALVKANREAPTLNFTSARGEVASVSTTAAIVSKHTPTDDMEAEVAALLGAAGAASDAAVAQAEDALAMKALTMEEVKERRDRLAKMRSLMFYQEQKAKRLKQIKSKEYHRKLIKAEKFKAAKLAAQGEDEEDDGKEAVVEAEYERAKERLTLKHRNTSRWARRALKRGVQVMDEGTKAALQDQLQMGQSLRRKIEGTNRVRDSEDDNTSASDDDGDGEDAATRAKAKALDILAEGELEIPQKGLFSLPFMARALEKQRHAAQEMRDEMLKELEGTTDGDALDGDGFGLASSSGRSGGRMQFGFGDAAADGGESGSEPDGNDLDELIDSEEAAERVDGTEEAAGGKKGGRQGRAGSSGQVVRRGGAAGGKKFRAGAADEADLDAALEAMAAGARNTATGLELATRDKQPAGGYEAQREGLFDARPESSSAPTFIPVPKFQGAKPGHIFQKGPQGVGYYLDREAGAGAAGARADKGGTAKGQGNGRHAQTLVVGSNSSKIMQHQATRKGLGEGRLLATADLEVDKQPSSKSTGAGSKLASLHSTAGGDGDDDDGDDEAFMKPVPGGKLSQHELVSQAFAGDDVQAEFQKEKAAEVQAELPKVDEPSTLPGWGMWKDQQREPKWMKEAKIKAQRAVEKAAAGRADSNMSNVLISEKWDRKASKYTVQSLPFPYESKEAYERSTRQPLGRQYNPDAAFRNLTRPAVLKSTGVMINPIRFSKASVKDVTAKGGAGGATGVANIANGLVKAGPRRLGKRKL